VIAVVDYGMGNLRSVERALRSLGASVLVTRDPDGLREADRLVLPGVGAFGVAMERLRSFGLAELLTELVMEERRPFLGICLGMQLVLTESHEHGRHAGLGWVPGVVRRLDPGAGGLRVPHVGWNDVAAREGSALLPDGAREGVFYFVHSFHAVPEDPDDSAATCSYGEPFTAVIERDNVLATQFHPEKSQTDGLALLGRFLSWQPARASAV
jgi:glutamine amidotransferase